MLCGLSIVRCSCRLVAAALVVASFASQARADQIQVRMNVLYSDPGDNMSGGTWQISAMSDGFGIAGLQLLLSGITAGSEVLAAPRGFVNGTDPAGISAIDRFTSPLGFREVDVYQQPVAVLSGGERQSIFYGIGTLTNGTPETLLPGGYGTITGGTGIPWAPVPPGDALGDENWDAGALLVTGIFSAGSTPGFYSDGSNVSTGVLLTTLGSSSAVGTLTPIESLMTSVRTNLLPDYNDDGVVDAGDYVVWRAALANGTPLFNDTTPGVVDENDFLVWKQYFGAIVPGSEGSGAGFGAAGAGLAASSVPEPTTWTLLLGAAGVLFLRPKMGLLRKVRFP